MVETLRNTSCMFILHSVAHQTPKILKENTVSTIGLLKTFCSENLKLKLKTENRKIRTKALATTNESRVTNGQMADC